MIAASHPHERRNAGLREPRHEFGHRFRQCRSRRHWNAAAHRSGGCSERKSASRRPGPEEERLSRAEVPAPAVALCWKEERAKAGFFVSKRIDARPRHGELIEDPLPCGVLEDREAGDRGSAVLGHGSLDDGAATPADVPKIPRRIEAQVPPCRRIPRPGARGNGTPCELADPPPFRFESRPYDRSCPEALRRPPEPQPAA